MRANVSFIGLTFLIVAIFIAGCKSQKSDKDQTLTKQHKAEDAIKEWMLKSNEFPHYKPIVFGDLTPRYERSSRTLQLSTQISEEEARSKETGDTEELDSLRAIMERSKGNLLGYILPHKFQETNLAGETLNQELLFFLDTSLRVASVMEPESFDHILDENVFFELDPGADTTRNED
ncbi:MAG: hypothetical protein ACLFNU_02380 [Bacteroidales bacterium]